jgi:hypothetical protein
VLTVIYLSCYCLLSTLSVFLFLSLSLPLFVSLSLQKISVSSSLLYLFAQIVKDICGRDCLE